MGASAGPDIVDTGLVLALDAADRNSYPGSGTAWVDLKLDAGAGPPIVVEYLVVAGGGGGGGGGAAPGAGGGAGGVLTNIGLPPLTLSANTYEIIVGSGGSGGGSGGAAGSNGNNSSAFSVVAIGGGGGGSACGSGAQNGGSGGGAPGTYFQFCSPTISLSGGTGTSGQGNNGGSRGIVSNIGAETRGAAGGGGAGGAGTTSNSGNNGKNGGSGIANSITGSSVFYGGGGGGGAGSFNPSAAGGSGGSGGGATGGFGRSGNGSILGTAGGNGTANSGGGGGGSVDAGGGNGGSGIVIVRYPGSQRATGGTVTSVDGYTIHTFTTSGTFITNMGNNGTLVNGVGYNSGNRGSLVFDGVDDYVSCGSGSSINISGNFYICVWAYLNATPSSAQVILERGANGSSDEYGLILSSVPSLVVSFQCNNSFFYSNRAFPVNRLTYVVGTLSGTNGIYYENALSVNSGTLTAPTTGNSIFNLGYRIGVGFYYNGNIAQASIYNRSLTASEISQNFNATRSRFGI